VCVDRIQGEFVAGGQFDHFGASCFQLAAQRFMLGLGDLEIRFTEKTQITPTCRAFRLVPATGARRADYHASQCIDHGVTVGARFDEIFGLRISEFPGSDRHRENLNRPTQRKQSMANAAP
jgi:hypothetical protein